MPETNANVEFAHKIHESSHHGHARSAPVIEILETVALAIVAVATAWSGFQAAKWDGHSAENYAIASARTVESQAKAAFAGQDRLYDTVTFNGWMVAATSGNTTVAQLYERRFRPDYATAFAAWMKFDPLKNPTAPPGPDYTSPHALEAQRLAEEAKAAFEHAVEMREIGDRYIKITVLLATGLLLTALGQRFTVRSARITVVAVTFLLIGGSLIYLAMLPRA